MGKHSPRGLALCWGGALGPSAWRRLRQAEKKVSSTHARLEGPFWGVGSTKAQVQRLGHISALLTEQQEQDEDKNGREKQRRQSAFLPPQTSPLRGAGQRF